MLFMLLTVLTVGCSDEAEVIVDTTPQIRVTCNTDFQLPSSNATEGTITYQVLNPLSGDVIAEAESNASWLRPQLSTKGKLTTSSEGLPMLEAKINYTVAANKGAARTAVLTITYAGKHDVELTIRQPESGIVEEKVTALTLSTSSSSVGAAAGSVAIEYVVTNPSSGVATGSSSESWVSVGTSNSGTLSKNNKGEEILTATLPISYEANTGSARTAKITVTYGEVSTTFTLNQAAASGGGDTPATNFPGSGKYLFVASTDGGEIAASPLAAEKNYGYLPGTTLTIAEKSISADATSNALAWTIAESATKGQYTLLGADNRYYYMTGTYNSFNVSADAGTEGYLWSFSQRTDGTWSVQNIAMSKTLQYDTAYSSFGVYPDERGVFLAIYKLNAAGTAYELVGEGSTGGGGDDPTPPTPPTPDTDELAGKYMLIWKIDGVYKAATPAATYYILSKDVTVTDHAVTASGNSDAEWTIESASTAGQYTIKGSDGKYYAMKGTYNSFNTDATLTNSDLSYNWTISKESDGTWTVMNVDKQKWMQWDANYGNAIASTGAGARPMLFKLNAAGTAYENLSPVEGGDDPGTDDPVTPPTPTGKTLVSGWAELPETIEKSGDYYYTWHITDVKYANGNKARNYTVCYSKDKMCAMWVAAPMHDFYEVKNSDRTDDYATDPNIDFTQPGKWDGYTRGHLLGSSERLVSRKANQQVFYYSNIAPQYGQPYFNTGGGAWNTLEDYTQQQWAGAADTTYQVIGCYWDPAKSVKKVNGTTIPTHYYKVLLRTKNHVNKAVWQCSADELQCVAFMIEHKTYDKSEVPDKSTYVSKGVAMSVSDLEKKTGFVYFGNVPNAPKNTFNASDWGL